MRRGFLFGSVLAASLAVLSATTIPSGHAYAAAEPAASNAGSFSGAYLAGRVAEGDNDLPAAISYYRQALAYDPQNLQLRQSLLLALLTDGQFEKALPIAEELKTTADIERFSRLALGVDAMAKKDYREVRNLMKLALQSDLDRLVTSLISAWALVGEGETEEALASIKKIEGPEGFGLFKTYMSALIADMAGEKQKARDFYQQTIDDRANGAAAPDTYERAINAYASFKLRNGEKLGALATVKDGEEMLTGRMAIQQLRKAVESGAKLDRLVNTPQEGAAEVLYTVATAINRGGGEAFSKLYLQMARPLRPDHDATLFQLGNISAQLRQQEKSIDYFGDIKEGSIYKEDADLQRALNLADLERTKEAEEQLKAMLKADPDNMRGYLALGGVYGQMKDFQKAADLYEKAVARIKKPDRTHWPIFYQRGIAYERLKEWPKAEPNFKEALKLFPDQPQVLNYLGYSWVDMNINLDDGLNMIRKAVELRPQDGYIVDSLGWAYYRLGRFDDAVAELEKAVMLRPEDPTINDHLGDAYWRSGRKLEATFQWSHARDLKPEPADLVKIEKKLKEGLPDDDLPGVARNHPPAPPVKTPDKNG
ncbi:MAG: tetratricopeptide repeat protein [Phyllobacterium sp.]